MIYSTNAIEVVHRQFRNLTKTKGAFPNGNCLLKLLYVGIHNASIIVDDAPEKLEFDTVPTRNLV